MNLRAPASKLRATGLATRATPLHATLALACAFVALTASIGADARWLPALGREIVDRGGIPDGVPFASAPSAGWPNVPVLAELVLRGLTVAFGERGFLLAQLIAVAGAFTILAMDMRRGGASSIGSTLVVLLVFLGAIPALLVIRVQLFSLLLFPALAALLRAEARRPSRRIWLVPLLLALWSNLHGAALVGLGAATAYLIFDRLRTRAVEAVTLVAASVVALCMTPALERTPAYYYGVLQNEAARRGEGLWAPLSFNSGFDLLTVASGITLVGLALWKRPALWESVVVVALVVLTVRTARTGVWLLFFSAPLAALAVDIRSCRRWPLIVPFAVALVIYGIVHGPPNSGADDRLLGEAIRRSKGTPILADAILAEQLALARGRVWMTNPLDAFPPKDQRVYLDWLEGRPGGRRALAHAPRIVLARPHSAAARLTANSGDWRRADGDADAILFVRG